MEWWKAYGLTAEQGKEVERIAAQLSAACGADAFPTLLSAIVKSTPDRSIIMRAGYVHISKARVSYEGYMGARPNSNQWKDILPDLCPQATAELGLGNDIKLTMLIDHDVDGANATVNVEIINNPYDIVPEEREDAQHELSTVLERLQAELDWARKRIAALEAELPVHMAVAKYNKEVADGVRRRDGTPIPTTGRS